MSVWIGKTFNVFSWVRFKKIGQQLGHQKNWTGSVYEVYNKASLNKDWTRELQQYSKSKGLGFITSPYSKELIDYTNEFLDAIKIGSGDITWSDILEYAAKQGKPILLGTGASNIEEVDEVRYCCVLVIIEGGNLGANILTILL